MHIQQLTEELRQQQDDEAKRLDRIYFWYQQLIIEFSMEHDLSGLEMSLMAARFQYEHIAGTVDAQPVRDKLKRLNSLR